MERFKIEIVYKIVNKINNRFYIGSTGNFKKRMRVHFEKSEIDASTELRMDIEHFGKDCFDITTIKEFDNVVDASRLESSLIRSNDGNPMIYNKMMGSSGRRTFHFEDIVFIRNLYQSCDLYITDAYEKYYEDRVTFRAFKKLWHGETFKDVHYHVYTKDNKAYHFAKGQSRPGSKNGRSIYNEEDVINIRRRRDCGELKEVVFQDYSHLNSIPGFDGIWHNHSWKHIK